jgi:glycosyltransferase involved in cell wall biosynthesis
MKKKQSRPEISIVVPVYNVAPYLQMTLDSILNQSITAWEAILVNDGSSDNSLDILNEYNRKDSRFKVYDKKNGGVNTARLLGLEKATADYITFMDGDDLLPAKAFEKMLSKIKETGVDIVVGQQFVTYDSTIDLAKLDNKVENIPSKYKDVFSYKDLDYVHMYISIWFNVFGNKIYKRSLWNGVKFPPHLRMAEDQIVIKQVLLKAKKCIAISDFVYVYKKRSGSATTTRSTKAFDVFMTCKLMRELFIEKKIYDQEYTNFYRFFYFTFVEHMRHFLPYSLWYNFISQMRVSLAECDVSRFNMKKISKLEVTKIKHLINASPSDVFILTTQEYIRVIGRFFI